MLTQTEANALIAMQKTFVDSTTISISSGTGQTHELIGANKRERFLLDLRQGTLKLSKLKYQIRGLKVVVLVRLDIDGAPHTNPDGTKLGGSHIHLYRQGYDDKFAFPISTAHFSNVGNPTKALVDFYRFCPIR